MKPEGINHQVHAHRVVQTDRYATCDSDLDIVGGKRNSVIMCERDHLIPYLIRRGGLASNCQLNGKLPDVVLKLKIVHVSGEGLYGNEDDGR